VEEKKEPEPAAAAARCVSPQNEEEAKALLGWNCDECDYCTQYGCDTTASSHCIDHDLVAANASAFSAAAVAADAAAAASNEPPKNEPRMEQLIEDYLTCSICKKPMSHTVALSCSHVYCRYCINQWFYAWPKKCPECRKVHARITITRVPHLDKLIRAAVCVSSESTKEHDARLKAADEEYAVLQETIKKDREEKEARDRKDVEEALKGSSSEDEEDEEFSDQGSSESDGEKEEEEEEEEEEPLNTRRSSRNAKPVAAAAASTRATRGQKRKLQ
jgi:hypothetical protein